MDRAYLLIDAFELTRQVHRLSLLSDYDRMQLQSRDHHFSPIGHRLNCELPIFGLEAHRLIS